MFEFRQLEASDKERVLQISSKIWEGDDYMERVFDSWVTDKNGEFVAALRNNVIVGFAKITLLTPHYVWLEGLRADPDSTERGIGTALTQHILHRLKQIKTLKSIRFTSYYLNVESRRLSEKLGFKPVLSLSNMHLDLESEKLQQFQDAKSRTFPYVHHEVALKDTYDLISSSEFLKLSGGLLYIGWVGYPFSLKMLDELFFSNDQFLVTKEGDEITGLLLYDMHKSYWNCCSISYFYAQNNAIADRLISDLLALSIQKGMDSIEVKIPDCENLLDYFKSCGYGFYSWESENDFLLYEYPLPID
jgi:N-acetylglutamate synthase-like GNAT family acetyltransferase